eukprot:3792909-Rhodomonas_salina.1
MTCGFDQGKHCSNKYYDRRWSFAQPGSTVSTHASQGLSFPLFNAAAPEARNYSRSVLGDRDSVRVRRSSWPGHWQLLRPGTARPSSVQVSVVGP